MEWITNSKLFKASKDQDKILAAIQNPVNKQLVQQLTSYVDSDYAEKLKSRNDDNLNDVDNSNNKNSNESENQEIDININTESTSHHSSPSMNFNPSVELPEESITEETPESDVEAPSSPTPESSSESSENVNESTKLAQDSKIIASTYTTIEDVSKAVLELPGILNLREETAGVEYADLKSNANHNNEIWIYYNSTVDISKILCDINVVLYEAGLYFLEFVKVSRDDNAAVFAINWISNYFNPIQVKALYDEV